MRELQPSVRRFYAHGLDMVTWSGPLRLYPEGRQASSPADHNLTMCSTLTQAPTGQILLVQTKIIIVNNSH